MGDPSGWREPFEAALDADPSDQGVRRDLADHLDELGDADAEPVRWLTERGLWPTEPGSAGPSGWNWWRDPAKGERHRDQPYAHASLPEVVADECWDRYPNRREAEAAFCRAYHEAKAAGWNPGSE